MAVESFHAEMSSPKLSAMAVRLQTCILASAPPNLYVCFQDFYILYFAFSTQI